METAQIEQVCQKYLANNCQKICQPILADKVDQICHTYLEQQRKDIFANLRTFARYDRDIQYFLEKIMDQLSIELEKYKKEMIEDIKGITQQYKSNYEEKTSQSIQQIDKHLERRISQIIAQSPYDVISQKFLDEQSKKLQYSIQKDFGDKIDNLQFLCWFLIVLVIAMGFYIKLNLQ